MADISLSGLVRLCQSTKCVSLDTIINNLKSKAKNELISNHDSFNTCNHSTCELKIPTLSCK